MTSMVLFIFLSLFKCDKTESRELFKTLSISPLLNLFDIVNISNTIITIYSLKSFKTRTCLLLDLVLFNRTRNVF